MPTPLSEKSTTQAIKERFDNDVERFSSLETGQQTVIDARLILDLVSTLSASVVPHAEAMLDIGCGAGNNTIRIVREFAAQAGREQQTLNCDLADLSQPMLDKAQARLAQEPVDTVRTFQGDFRSLDLPENHYDIIVAAAVLHHLRDDEDWLNGFARIHSLLKPNGALFVSDLFIHGHEKVHEAMWNRYGDYLIELGGVEKRDAVFDYIDYEDSPRDLTFQIETLRKVGFRTIDILHKNSVFGAYVAVK